MRDDLMKTRCKNGDAERGDTSKNGRISLHRFQQTKTHKINQQRQQQSHIAPGL